MSEVSDKFFELLIPKLEQLGYDYKKSKKTFVKKTETLDYIINFRWDGRGGAVHLDSVFAQISSPRIVKNTKKVLQNNYGIDINLFKQSANCFHDNRIPPMYSEKMYQLFADVNLREMAKLSFEEKYPLEKIEHTSNVVFDIIENELIAFHQDINEWDLFEDKLKNFESSIKNNETNNLLWDLLLLKTWCRFLKINEPSSIININLFSNQSIDASWNFQPVDYQQMEERFNSLVFV